VRIITLEIQRNCLTDYYNGLSKIISAIKLVPCMSSPTSLMSIFFMTICSQIHNLLSFLSFMHVPGYFFFTKDVTGCLLLLRTSICTFYWPCIRVSSLYSGYTRLPYLISWINPGILPCIVNAPEIIPYMTFASGCTWMNAYKPECFLCVVDISGCAVLNHRHILMFLTFSWSAV
jgi:hypothetical protein